MKESNFTAMTPRPKTPDFIKALSKACGKSLFTQKTVIGALKNSDHKTGAATNRVAFAAAPFPTPHTEKAKRKQKRLFFLAISANFIIDYKPYRVCTSII